MALIKKGFKKFEKEDIRTDYKPFVPANKEDIATSDIVYPLIEDFEDDVVLGTINKNHMCIPAGTVIKVAVVDDTHSEVSLATAGDITQANFDSGTVYLLAEDLYPAESATYLVDNGFVYYIVENVNNLEDRA